MIKRKPYKGISIIEILVVIAIIGILSGVSAGAYFYFKKGANFDLSAQQVANLIRRAQNKSIAMENDDAWGINITSQQAIIFKGTNFSGRNQSFDEKTTLTEIMTVSGSSQFIFNKFTGFPISPGSLIVDNGSASKTIQVNAKGFVNF